MQIIVSYPGRFQPWCIHHSQAYAFLCAMFGKNNVYVTTTNNISLPDSPLNFSEKRSIIEKYVPYDHIVQVKSPYKSEELLSSFDLNNTISIFAYSYKDSGRIAYNKIDGSPGYFKPLTVIQDCNPASQNGYILVLPQYRIRVNGKEVSGTVVRNFIRNIISKDPSSKESISLFRKTMGWYDKTLYNNIIKKF